MPKTTSKDVAAEIASTDSLSFAGLICIEEKSYESPKVHASPPTKKDARRGQEDLDFEFVSVVDKSMDNASNKHSLADVLFSGGHPLPQAIQSQANESGVLEHVNSKQSSRPPRSSKKVAGDYKVGGATESVKKTDTTNKASKQHTTAGQWFGQKIIKSIATPCRDCRAVQPSPSMKEQSVRH